MLVDSLCKHPAIEEIAGGAQERVFAEPAWRIFVEAQQDFDVAARKWTKRQVPIFKPKYPPR